MNNKVIQMLLLILLLVVSGVEASECNLVGKVVKVTDGDTVTVLEGKTQHKIRLTGIDAPERGQPFGKKSKQYLTALIARKQVCVDWHKKDRYQRKVGKILLGGVDINLKMIEKGLAWHYKKYAKEQTKVDDRKYAEAEIDAQLSTIGLWSRPDYIAPWNWRKKIRPQQLSTSEKFKRLQEKRRNKTAGNFVCGTKRFCKEMNSCAEATFYLTTCGLNRLDRDKDSIPCESICL